MSLLYYPSLLKKLSQSYQIWSKSKFKNIYKLFLPSSNSLIMLLKIKVIYSLQKKRPLETIRNMFLKVPLLILKENYSVNATSK